MRPIDADKIPYVEALTDTFEPSGKFYARLEDISAMPTIDSVPVVRCKDCKYRDPEDKNCDCGHVIIWQLPRDDNWFCADGKRMADDPSHPFADDVMMGERRTDERFNKQTGGTRNGRFWSRVQKDTKRLSFKISNTRKLCLRYLSRMRGKVGV